MSNAFAPRPQDEFDDEFDLDMGYTPSGVPGQPAGDPALVSAEAGADQRPPLQFTAPAVAAPVRPGFSPVSALWRFTRMRCS